MIQFLAIIVGLVAYGWECEPFDQHLTLGDYYKNAQKSQDLLYIQFKTRGECASLEIVILLNQEETLRIPLFSHPMPDKQIYHQTGRISTKDGLEFDENYSFLVRDNESRSEQFRFRIPQKIANQEEEHQFILLSSGQLEQNQPILDTDSHVLLIDGNKQTKLHNWNNQMNQLLFIQEEEEEEENQNSIYSFDIETVHFIKLSPKRNEIGKLIEQLEQDLTQIRSNTNYQPWIVILSENLDQNGLLMIEQIIKLHNVDVHIPKLDDDVFKIVAKGRSLQEDIIYNEYNPLFVGNSNSMKLMQIRNGTHMEIEEIDNKQQILQRRSFVRLLQTNNSCLPYGQRITLGYYYTYQQDQNDMANIAFNTLGLCRQAYIKIWDDYGYEAILPLSETRILNMTKIYENSTIVNYDYVTYINIVKLGQNNIPGDDRIYQYSIVGDDDNEIGPFMFKIPGRQDNNKERKYMFFGDMDSNWVQNNSNYTFNYLQARTSREYIEEYDFFMFMGDMAYDLESHNCQQGDNWLRNMSVFTAYHPFMVIPGNHDSGNNSDYPYIRRSFLSPKSHLDTATYYTDFVSFDLGLVHFISYNPDWIVYQTASQEYIDFVVQLFKDDLDKAQSNRQNVPWIIVNSHYPMYCSDSTDYQCGYNWVTLQPLAELFTQYNVEVYMSAHQHSYERDSPFINNQTAQFETDGPQQHIIKNSNAPVYIIEGAAGNDYFMPDTPYTPQPYTVFQSINDGVGVITIKNATHLYFEHIDVTTNQVVDYVWVIQDRPSPTPDYHWFLIISLVILIIIVVIIFIWYFSRRETLRLQLLP